VLLDKDKSLTPEQTRIYSCIRFVADECIPVAFYLNDDWSKAEILKAAGFNLGRLNEHQKKLLESFNFSDKILSGAYNKEMPKMIYISQKDWDMRNKQEKNLPVKILKNEVIFSSSNIVNKLALESQGINSNTAVLCLAACGLDITLPNLSFNIMADEEIEKIRDTLYEERINYLNAITKLAQESYDRINSGDFSEIFKWAQNEVTFQLMPKARILERQASRVQKTTLKDAGFTFFKEGIPAIGKGYINGGLQEASKITAEEFFKLITFILSQDTEQRTLPEIAYALKISKILDDTCSSPTTLQAK